MKERKVIFTDSEIVAFCRATRDTNVIHDPAFMKEIGKRVIVPGMFALSATAGLTSEYLKERGRSIRVLFNSLLSSGDFATLKAGPAADNPDVVRLFAINHKDTFTTRDEYTLISPDPLDLPDVPDGILHRLDVDPQQLDDFRRLTQVQDPETGSFLFTVAYASQALLHAIMNPVTEVEWEIDALIHNGTGVSPFYHTLEILIPRPFPVFSPEGAIDYYVHFEREKKDKLYTAYVRCMAGDTLAYHSRYQMLGINNQIILRMAKEILHHRQ